MRILLFLCGLSLCAAKIANIDFSYNVDPSDITTSGLSAGGAFAIQLHVAYSQTFTGVASYAGLVYRCARGNVFTATGDCMVYTNQVDVDKLITDANEYEAEGLVDPLTGLSGSKVYVFHGTNDGTVGIRQTEHIQYFYENYGAEVIVDESIHAGHGIVTLDNGIECQKTDKPYINNCDYNSVFVGLNYILGGSLIDNPNIPIDGVFTEFDQNQFNGGPHMRDNGYIYFPSNCVYGETCRLHIALHGCDQSSKEVDEQFAQDSGYLEVAEANNIIMVFPQAKDSLIDNPNSCWDWWGYDNKEYANNQGKQMMAMKAMVDYLLETSSNPQPVPTEPPVLTELPGPQPTDIEWCPCLCPCPEN